MLSDFPGPMVLMFVLFALPAFLGACLWRSVALRRGWVDQPDDRRLHRVPTPRGGGIGIALVLATVLFLVDAAGPGHWLLVGMLVTAGGGLLDDLRPLPAPPKLGLQALGTLPLAWVWPLQPDLLGPTLSLLAAWALAMALVNAWNFMDGSDGLVASQAALVGAAAVALATVAPGGPESLLWAGLALAAACVGFLPMNAPRARVFLGDVGSHAIGYAVAALALVAIRTPGLPDALVWLPGSAVVVDTSLTLSGRILRGERFWLGHREHMYQRAIAAGWSHMGIAGAYAAWTLAASGLALALTGSAPGTALAVTIAVYAAGILLYVWTGRRWPRPDRKSEGVG